MVVRAISSASIEKAIAFVRGQRVLLDAELASLYGVETRALNQAVLRNLVRFPVDFRFQLTTEEVDCLRSQIVISKSRGGRRYLPFAFTEHGVAMAATVLSSTRAVAVSIEIIRVFVRLRHILAANVDLARRIGELESRMREHTTENDKHFRVVFDALRRLMAESDAEGAPRQDRIGFHVQ